MFRLREVAVLVMMVATGSVLYHPAVSAYASPRQQQDPVQQQAPVPANSPQQDATPAQAPAPQNAPQQEAAPAQTSAPSPAPAAPPAAPAPEPQSADAPGTPGKLMVTVGKSLIIDSPLNIRRVHVANGALAEAVAVNPKEVLINGTAPGETSLIVWQQDGNRLVYDLTIRMSGNKLEATRAQIARDFPTEDISLTFENDSAFVRGTVKDVTAGERIVAIASTLGKVINLLRVEVPAVQPQILLKVRFANVDRTKNIALGFNMFNSSFNQQTSLGTGGALYPNDQGKIPVGQAVNLLLLRPDLNLVAEIQALQSRNVLEMLAEPNLLTISGEQASFLAGGEFPFPVIQPSASGGSSSVTIQWREYGVRLSFLPVVTPRGTIRMKVAPEVSALDYTNAVNIQGFTIPGLSSRRVSTDVELDSGQSFVIAGLLDNQTTENLSKVPGISAIPVLGKLFQSKVASKSNSELLVIITPEVVRPIPAGQATPELTMPSPFLPANSVNTAMRHPGMDKTGPVPVKAPVDSLPFEMLVAPPRPGQASQTPNTALPPGVAPGGAAPATPTTATPVPVVPPATSGGNGK